MFKIIRFKRSSAIMSQFLKQSPKPFILLSIAIILLSTFANHIPLQK